MRALGRPGGAHDAMMQWRRAVGIVAVAATIACDAQADATTGFADLAKTLRVSLPIAESGFDPAASGDYYSNTLIGAMFDTLYEWDYLARPFRVVPRAAEALPEISADGRAWTIRIRRGIHFADDPVFKGRPRELTAQDYVYSWKRILDPRTRSPSVFLLRGKFVGADAAVAKASETGRFDYDAEIEGLRAADRYTLKLTLTEPDFALLPQLTLANVAAVAREVIEAYGDGSGWVQANPVGTGAFKLAQWRRGQKIVLEANRDYRPEMFPAAPADADAATRAAAESMRGKRMPQVGRVEVSVIEESNPQLLAFNSGALDYFNVPRDHAPRVLDASNRLLPYYAEQGVTLHRAVEGGLGFYAFFDLRDPLVGGYTPEKIALRRAILSAFDVPAEISVALQGQATMATQIVPPGVSGHEAGARSWVPYDPALARALLDKFGFVDRDGDGYREQPDGRPLTLRMGSATSSEDRIREELWKRSLQDVGLRVEFVKQKWPELLKMTRGGKLPMWQVSYAASDGDLYMQLAYSPSEDNLGHFANDEYDRLYRESRKLRPGPERDRAYAKLNAIVAAYAPFGAAVYRWENTLVRPWVRGYVKNVFQPQSWRFVDIDLAKRNNAR
jgi:oligopeptide transport system substrate-binding protein